MATESVEIRMARLEGAYEQITVRLAGVEREVGALRAEIGSVRGEVGSLRGDMGSQFAEMRRRMDAQFYWLLTLVLGSILIPVLRDLAR